MLVSGADYVPGGGGGHLFEVLWGLPLTPLIYTNGIPVTRVYAGFSVDTKKGLAALRLVLFEVVLQIHHRIDDVHGPRLL